MAYSLSGEFFEACDCDVVCSCWAGVPPVMGTCTGLFAWHITTGVVDAVDVSGCSAMLLFNGLGALLLIGGFAVQGWTISTTCHGSDMSRGGSTSKQNLPVVSFC